MHTETSLCERSAEGRVDMLLGCAGVRCKDDGLCGSAECSDRISSVVNDYPVETQRRCMCNGGKSECSRSATAT